MSFRVLVTAAAVAIGFGQAEAATVNYDIDLRYLGTRFVDVDFAPHGQEDGVSLAELQLEGNPFGVTGRYSHLSSGDIVKFVAEVAYTDDPYNTDTWPSSFDNGGRAYSCSLAGVACEPIMQAFPGEPFMLFYWDVSEYYGSLVEGSIFTHSLWDPMVPRQDTGTGYFYAKAEFAEFEVVRVNQPAPVPVPLSAALLPFGLGAFAVMRKRRRPA